MGWTPTPEQRAALTQARALAQEMRNRGITWKAIADRLTADGYPTRDGGAWYIEGVRRLVKNPPPSPPSAKYGARHARVRNARGNPEQYECARCGAPALVWATLHGTDGMSPEDYEPMCQACNLAYDGVTGSPRSAETRAKMSAYASNRTREHQERLNRSRWGARRSGQTRGRLVWTS